MQLCEAKMSVIRVESRTSGTSKMELFLTIVKEWKLEAIKNSHKNLNIAECLLSSALFCDNFLNFLVAFVRSFH